MGTLPVVAWPMACVANRLGLVLASKLGQPASFSFLIHSLRAIGSAVCLLLDNTKNRG